MKEEEHKEEEQAEEQTEEQAEEQPQEQAEEQSSEESKKDRLGRTLHKTTCSDCGKETEVPFEPSGDRPVYCRDCYQKHRPKRRF